jgi:hypothetical protein
MVRVTGRDFSGGLKYKCKFGKIVVPASFQFDAGVVVSDDDSIEGVGFGRGGAGRHGVILCQAPPALVVGHVDFGLSFDGTHFTSSSSSQQYLYYNPVPSKVIQISPYVLKVVDDKVPIGSIDGGTLLKVSFVENDIHECEHSQFKGSSTLCGSHNIVNFVGMRPRCRFDKVEVHSLYNGDSNELFCISPAVDAHSIPANMKVDFSVSLNDGNDYSFVSK